MSFVVHKSKNSLALLLFSFASAHPLFSPEHPSLCPGVTGAHRQCLLSKLPSRKGLKLALARCLVLCSIPFLSAVIYIAS